MSISTLLRYEPLVWLIIESAVMFVVWTVAMILLRGKLKRVTAIAGAVVSVLLIVLNTLVRHTINGGIGVHLIPFSSFSMVAEIPGIYRSMQLNIILFMPFGMSLPFVLPEKLRLKPLITVCIALIISVTIEVCQYIFNIGMSEIDDVIMNTLGAAIGTVSYLLVSLILKKLNKRGGKG